MLENPQNGQITYTRNGRFSLSQFGNEFYLVNDSGNYVLDQNGNRIRVTGGNLSGEIGVYRFNVLDGMLSVGDNEFSADREEWEPDIRCELQRVKNLCT